MTLTEPAAAALPDPEELFAQVAPRILNSARAALGLPPLPEATVIPATGLIPDVTDGALIESAWGNAIRDRATQRFDTLAALQAGWPGAANGARAVTLDTFRFYTKRAAGGTGWQPDMDFGSPTMTPDAQGRVTVTHALGRASVFAMAVMSSPGFVITEAITTTTVQFRLFNNAGAVITVSTFFRWAAW